MTSITTYRSNIREDYLKDPKAKIRNNSMVDRAINKGVTEIQKDLNWTTPTDVDNETFSTVQGTQQYALPSDFIALKLARYNGLPLNMTDLYTLKRQFPTFTSGQPYWYYLYGSNIGFYPIPSGVGTIDMEYYKSVPKVTEAQECTLPDDFDEAIQLFAAYKLFLGNRVLDAAGSYKQDYKNEVNKLKITYQFQDKNIKMGYQRRRPGRTARPDVLNP